MPSFEPSLMSRHAMREARRERISLVAIQAAYDDPDERRGSAHDPDRDIRTRWQGDEGVEVVVDRLDGRIVTVWRRGWKP